MNGENEANQGDRTRFAVDLPIYTAQRLDSILEKTKLTKTQLMILLVDQMYTSVVEQDGQAA